MTQPICVTPQEIQKVMSLFTIAQHAALTESAIARVLGPPVTADIVHELMRSKSIGILKQRPQAVAELIMSAKRRGEARRLQVQGEET